MLILPGQYIQQRGRKQLHACRHIMPRRHLCAGAFFVRTLSPWVFSHHAGGAVRRRVHTVPCRDVGYFLGRHVYSGLHGVHTGLLQRHAQCNQLQHLPGLPCRYVFCEFWRSSPLLLP